MNYKDHLDLFGTKVKLIPNITGNGAPTSATEGAVGCMYMDTNNGNLYKCIVVTNGIYTWAAVGEGSGGIVPVVNVKDFGAIGDGVTDDTDAIRNARNAAATSSKALYFPAGTYMVRGSIELWSNCEIYGDGSKSVIKKIPAITQAVTKPSGGYTLGQTTFTVEDASVYTVGYDCVVTIDDANRVPAISGKIERIDGNSITIAQHPHQEDSGMSKSWVGLYNADGEEVLFSTSHSVFCNYMYKWPVEDPEIGNAVHDVYVHDITIDGNRQEGEPFIYPLSAINLSELPTVETVDNLRKLTKYNENIRIENVNIYNSPSDGISVQSSKNVFITNCITENCAFNGVHFGVGTDIASVVGCKLNADYSGYYDCADVGSVSLTGNHFEECFYGISGYDQATNGLTVTGNTFRGCTIAISTGVSIAPERMRGDLGDIDPADSTAITSPSHILGGSRARNGGVISNNTFYGIAESELDSGGKTVKSVTRTGIGIDSYGGEGFIISGNEFHHLATAIKLGAAKYIQVLDNYICDCTNPLSMPAAGELYKSIGLTNAYNCSFIGNTVRASAVDSSAMITIANAENMLVKDNIVVGNNAVIETGSNVDGVIIESNIVSAS